MMVGRDRLLDRCLLGLDLASVLVLPLGRISSLFFAAIYVGSCHALHLHDSGATPRRDTRFLAALLATALASVFATVAFTLVPGKAGLDPLRVLLVPVVGHLGRELLAALLQRRAERVVILGLGPRARRVGRAIRRSPFGPLRLVGFVAPKTGRFLGLPIWPQAPAPLRVLDPRFGIDLDSDLGPQIRLGEQTLRIAEGPGEGVSRALKRGLDLVLVLGSLPVSLLLFVLLLVLNRVVQGSPALHRQTRITLQGRVFTIYKLRSMPVDAEPSGKPVWPAAEDHRITAMGKILRGSWLDELPQLWNVLRGDLALVGPRPERPEFVQVFERCLPRYPIRHRARSGITGLAQVRGFVGNTSLRKRLLSDLQYIENWSFWLDVAVLGRTLCQVLQRQKRQRFDYVPGDEGPIP